MPPLFMSFPLVIFPKNLNNLSKSCEAIPIPVSATVVIIYFLHPSSDIIRLIAPLKVNFAALPIRLKRICLYLLRSEKIILGTLFEICTFNCTFFLSTWNFMMSLSYMANIEFLFEDLELAVLKATHIEGVLYHILQMECTVEHNSQVRFDL